MSGRNEAGIAALFDRWRGGDAAALDDLLPLVYTDLRQRAGRLMRDERNAHTLQPTALVHEAVARLLEADVEWNDRVHFVALAAQTMRRVLVDHAKARNRDKRGGQQLRVTLDDDFRGATGEGEDLLALDEALTRLARQDERKSRLVELHYFGGLSYAELAAAADVSEITVFRDLRLARAWLFQELGDARQE